MKETVTQLAKNSDNIALNRALEKWERCKPPYTGAHMRICVAAAKIILKITKKPRLAKYEKDLFLRIIFSKTGRVSIYAEFPKKMRLKG